ncbi:MAG: hypothetical protein JWO85_916 [Candidatus Eremiobacteraeota bacterium]|nr:hypothetical protein [Candidatus Eremiobacteraeota bacterium]
MLVDGTSIGAPPTLKSRSLLAYLALRRGERVRREHLTAEFWPDAEPTNARNNLKTALSAIRKLFRDGGTDPDGVLAAERDAVRWTSPVSIDAREVERCSTDLETERARVIALYGGVLMPGDYNAWAVELRDRLAARFEDTLRGELAAHPSVELAERVLLLDPFCDDAYLVLIEAALDARNQREALAVFRRYAGALAEVGSAPSAMLARRLGVHVRGGTPVELGFFGRASELAEVREWLAAPAASRALIVSGIAGIGKSALVGEALRGGPAAWGAVVVDAAMLDPLALPSDARVIVCARPEQVVDVRAALPDAVEIRLGALTRAEVALAPSRSGGAPDATRTAESLWAASLGHPLLINAELTRRARSGAASPSVPRFERDVERRFEEQLHAAGDDAVAVAELLALEPQLDADDLVALLDWSLERVGEARDRLAAFGIAGRESPARFAFPLFTEAAARRFGNGRRHQTIARITERLMLHEQPSARLQLAKHYVTLGRTRDAAAAALEAGRAFVTFAAWNNARAAFDEGVALLEGLATSPAATALLRELYLARAEVLYHIGAFAAALRSIDSALGLPEHDRDRDAAVRASALVTAGHAFSRLNQMGPAWLAARQAEDESRRAGVLATELEATSLVARLLCGAMRYEDAVACASAGYERALAAGAWTTASALAQRVAEALRRLLRFEECYRWTRRQLDAAAVAGPDVEALAHYYMGAIAYAVNRFDTALHHSREGLRLSESIRRRQTLPSFPLGHTEWGLHQALAHLHVSRGEIGDGLAECEWLVRSPWVFNTTACSAMTLATVVDVRLASNTEDDRRAAIALAERIPPASPDNPAAFLDVQTRARIAAINGPRARAVELFHDAYAAIVRAEPLVPDQIHISYEKVAQAARGVDDLLAARAAEAGRRHRQRVIDAAGPLWGTGSGS